MLKKVLQRMSITVTSITQFIFRRFYRDINYYNPQATSSC